MIKATGERDGKRFILFGLSEGNLSLLRQKKPIVVNLSEMGLSGEVLITYGETEADIILDLQKAGLLPNHINPN